MSVDISESAQPDLTLQRARRVKPTGFLAAFSLVVAIGAVVVSSCCALPLALAMTGLGGAWLGSLSELVLYKEYVLAAAVVPLAIGWIMAVRPRPRGCSTEKDCASRSFKVWTYGALMLSTAFVCLAALSDLIEPGIVAYLMSLRGEG